jgi:hypothetical protein
MTDAPTGIRWIQSRTDLPKSIEEIMIASLENYALLRRKMVSKTDCDEFVAVDVIGAVYHRKEDRERMYKIYQKYVAQYAGGSNDERKA